MNITQSIDRLGTTGLFLTAILSPCCFPLFAFAGSIIGIGTQEVFGVWTMPIFQVMVVITCIGLFISYREHRCLYPLMIALPSALLVLYGYHFINSLYWTYFLYAGMLGLLASTIWNYQRIRMHSLFRNTDNKMIELKSTITCPHCGNKKTELMPEDSCVYFYECENCKTQLKPLKGDCCVFCSYGSVKCPPIQAGKSCC